MLTHAGTFSGSNTRWASAVLMSVAPWTQSAFRAVTQSGCATPHVSATVEHSAVARCAQYSTSVRGVALPLLPQPAASVDSPAKSAILLIVRSPVRVFMTDLVK